jgi:hypothetical protein
MQSLGRGGPVAPRLILLISVGWLSPGPLPHSGHDDRPGWPRDVVEACANSGEAVPDHSALAQ